MKHVMIILTLTAVGALPVLYVYRARMESAPPPPPEPHKNPRIFAKFSFQPGSAPGPGLPVVKSHVEEAFRQSKYRLELEPDEASADVILEAACNVVGTDDFPCNFQLRAIDRSSKAVLLAAAGGHVEGRHADRLGCARSAPRAEALRCWVRFAMQEFLYDLVFIKRGKDGALYVSPSSRYNSPLDFFVSRPDIGKTSKRAFVELERPSEIADRTLPSDIIGLVYRSRIDLAASKEEADLLLTIASSSHSTGTAYVDSKTNFRWDGCRFTTDITVSVPGADTKLLSLRVSGGTTDEKTLAATPEGWARTKWREDYRAQQVEAKLCETLERFRDGK